MAVNLLAPKPEDLHAVPGVRLGIAMAGVRKAGRRDLTVIALDEGAQVVGVFTSNRFCATPRWLASAAQVDLQWVSALPAAVEALPLPAGAGFVWAAGEHSDMAAVRRVVLAKPGVDPKRMRISAYWKRGAADHHEDLASAV